MTLDLRNKHIPKIKKDEIDPAVKDTKWQDFRRSLKGLDTEEKLDELEQWLIDNPGRKSEIQVINYYNALKRGGQVK